MYRPLVFRAPVYQWHAHKDGSGWGLFRDGVQVGWLGKSGTYYPLDGGVWGKACTPPVARPK